ncbi:MAG: ATP-binding protein, partial [Myxococcota bacterium]
RVAEQIAGVECGGQARELVEMTLEGPGRAPSRLEGACCVSSIDGQRAVVGIARDVTALSELQDEIDRARLRAGQIERLRALGELAAGVAHNFNNSLGAILGRAALARERLRRHEDVTEDLRAIETAAQDAAKTVQRIRSFSRPSGEDSWRLLDLRELAQEATQYVRPRLSRDMTLRIEIADVAPTRGSGTEVREVLVNLLVNAIEAVGAEGTVRIAVFNDHGHAVVEVEDDGPGMPPEVQRRIFEPFFTTKGAAGTGLGLSVSHEILRRHDARIHIHTAPGEGTRCRIDFAKAEGAEATAASAEPQEAPLSIVIVGDDAAAGEAFRDLLGAWGYRAAVVDDASEAARLIGANPVEIVFTDLDLARMSGWQLARKLREVQPRLRIGIVTAWPLTASAEELRARGVDFLLRRPFTVDTLARVLQRTSRHNGTPMREASAPLRVP